MVDCSTISVDESAAIRKRLKDKGADYVAAPVSGNAKVIKAGKLSSIVSGPEAACKAMMPLMEVIAPRGVAYAGEGELARVCKIAHNVMLGVVIENLIEITLLTNKMGVPRHAFLAFLNNSVMGSMFTAYKSPALVNLDWTTTFTPELLRKDLDLGLELAREMDVPMPVTAATREVLQGHFGAAQLQKNPQEYIQKDFAALAETMALAAGMKLASENKNVPTGLEFSCRPRQRARAKRGPMISSGGDPYALSYRFAAEYGSRVSRCALARDDDKKRGRLRGPMCVRWRIPAGVQM